ncbi:uncharacterized protein BX664DRAFT_340392 [Halteromyces radiatus]|uniref:uncharacterized protein n=1 Tax=Halteromyces radiatus TaxID=101107 RepID=UPI00221EDE5F|nr:uncharacterized protein BX664DRAFT_340392 [Halteromyces radiatus]KAI8081437.1 hypothetical protein BX664DRAFT_340392 [Halteromyces radiatus]
MQLKTILATVPMVMTMALQVSAQVSQVVDANNFCVYLPPPDSTNRNIADTEWNAQAYCLGSTPLAAKANKMPDGFIQSAHFVATNEYVQVTGQIDPAKANLNVTDDGGQMDIAAPKGSSCAGWKFYVNMIEPTGNTYCMRCCNDKVTCNRGISEKGCAHVIPGDYSGPMTGSGSGKGSGNTQPSVSVSISSSSASASSSSSSSASSSSASSSSASSSPSPSKLDTQASSSNGNPSSANDSGKVSAQSVNAAGISYPTTALTLLAIVFVMLTQ